VIDVDGAWSGVHVYFVPDIDENRYPKLGYYHLTGLDFGNQKLVEFKPGAELKTTALAHELCHTNVVHDMFPKPSRKRSKRHWPALAVASDQEDWKMNRQERLDKIAAAMFDRKPYNLPWAKQASYVLKMKKAAEESVLPAVAAAAAEARSNDDIVRGMLQVTRTSSSPWLRPRTSPAPCGSSSTSPTAVDEPHPGPSATAGAVPADADADAGDDAAGPGAGPGCPGRRHSEGAER